VHVNFLLKNLYKRRLQGRKRLQGIYGICKILPGIIADTISRSITLLRKRRMSFLKVPRGHSLISITGPIPLSLLQAPLRECVHRLASDRRRSIRARYCEGIYDTSASAPFRPNSMTRPELIRKKGGNRRQPPAGPGDADGSTRSFSKHSCRRSTVFRHCTDQAYILDGMIP